MNPQTSVPKNRIANLKQELAQREAELAIINSVQSGLAEHLEVQAIYDLVGDKIRDIFNAQVVMISPYDRQTNTVEHRYAIERGERVYSIGSHPPGGFRSKIIQTGQTILVNTNVAEEAARLGQPTLPGTKTPKSWLGVPMLVRGQVTGILSLQNVDEENAFNESHVRLLQTITGSMSVALENARLFAETQRLLKETEQRAAELLIINSIQAELAQKLDSQSIFELIGKKISTAVPVGHVNISVDKTQTIFFAFYDERQDKLDFPYVHQNEKGSGTNSWKPDMSEIKRMIEIHRTTVLNDPDELQTMGVGYIHCAIFVPLKAGLDIYGVLGVFNTSQENTFSNSDIHLLETLANAMSMALENAGLWEQQKLYLKAMEREFEIGREIQAGFLPNTLPQPVGWEIAASLKSAREVAGDFYDIFELDDGTIGLVIADVCDKGLGAALFMTLFRSLLRAISNINFFARTDQGNLNTSAARVKNAISLTNNYIVETHGETGMFATIFFGILNPKSGRLTYVNGGHLPPLLVNKQGLKKTLTISGPAVGAVPDTNYQVNEVQLEEDDTLFAYTDGLTDTFNVNLPSFSVEGLIPDLCGEQPLADLLVQFQAQMDLATAGEKQFDDITMLVVRRKK
ncbi:MAG: SpoIIE family protein phosphatase [Chloroflexota bacterium]